MRDIQNGLFGWYEKGAMEKIETLPRRQQAAAKLIYIAICSSSAKRKNSQEIECYKFEIAKFASVDEKTVQRHLPMLEILEIIKVYPQDRLSTGRYSKIKIRLNKANPTVGQLEESSEKVSGKLEESSETQSPIYIKKEKKLKKERNEEAQKSPIEEFFKNEEEQKALALSLAEKKKLTVEAALAEIQNFISYWTERTPDGKKQKWQLQKTFEVPRRLTTWFGNMGKFSPKAPDFKIY